MQLSQNPINRTLEKQLDEIFYSVLSEVNSVDELKVMVSDLFTEAERSAVLKRLGIALYLDKGRSYEDIKNNIKVSSATIATVAENLGNKGWQEMIRRVKAEEWARQWTDKITGSIKRIFR